jgi:alpha-L-fucosidase
MGWPEKEVSIAALGTASEQQPGKVHNVELLGHRGRLKWTQDAVALNVEMPRARSRATTRWR